MTASRTGGYLAAAGSTGILIATLFYASSPLAVSTPLAADANMAEILQMSQAATGRLRIAGILGNIANLLVIGGAMLLVLRHEISNAQKLYWIWSMLATLLFVFYDGIAGMVLPGILQAGDLATLHVARLAFDGAFLIGSTFAGAGLIAAWFADDDWAPLMRTCALVAGILAEIGVVLHLIGISVPQLFGLTVGLVNLAGLGLAILEARREGGE